MFVLTEQLISTAIDTISGYIVSVTAEETGKSIEEITEDFLSSNTYALLSDAETGYYWYSISELIDMFRTESKGEEKVESRKPPHSVPL